MRQINRILSPHSLQLELNILPALLIHLIHLLDDLVEAVVTETAGWGEAGGSVGGAEDTDRSLVFQGQLH